MSAQGGAAGSRALTSPRTTSGLDYGWGASDGPTAGYLVRRATDALEQSPDAGRGQARPAHVQRLRLAAADAIDISAGRASGAGRGPPRQPRPGGLVLASFSFRADKGPYDHGGHARLANHLSATAEGYCFELSEVWSDRGELLATAELIRASHDHHSAP